MGGFSCPYLISRNVILLAVLDKQTAPVIARMSTLIDGMVTAATILIDLLTSLS